MKDLNFDPQNQQEETNQRFQQSMQCLTEALEILLSNSEQNLSIFPHFAFFFEIFVYLDWITQQNKVNNKEELPMWVKLLLNCLNFNTENLIFEVLTIFLSFFNYQTDLVNVKNYRDIFYHQE